jgi:uncharacterized protein with FMN-binding domain
LKKGKKALLIVGIIIVVLVAAMAIGTLNGMSYVRKMTVNLVDLSKISDGVYAGSFKKGRFSYSVEVAVKDHRIQAAKPTDPKQVTSAIIEQIFARIVQDQSVRVDTVSGASLTTKAVCKAAENALNPAR